jgi:hypothetical protein
MHCAQGHSIPRRTIELSISNERNNKNDGNEEVKTCQFRQGNFIPMNLGEHEKLMAGNTRTKIHHAQTGIVS